MSLNETEARVRARVWQAIAQSELDVSSIDKETLDKLVSIVTESALVEVDSQLGETLQAQPKQPLVPTSGDPTMDDEEPILWEGRPFLSLTLYYKITDERIIISDGLLSKAYENIELIRIQDIAISQSMSERMLHIGDITIRSHDANQPTFYLNNIQNPKEVHEILRRAILRARKRHNFSYREEM